MKMARLSDCILLSLLNRVDNPSLWFSVINLLLYIYSRVIERQNLRLANLHVKQFVETISFTATMYVASLTYYMSLHMSFQDQKSDVAPVCLRYNNGGLHEYIGTHMVKFLVL